ncbi:MAG: MobC family plasmid mobilization relaxosome protein [Cyanobacteria bacterium P01_A01_bin.80]
MPRRCTSKATKRTHIYTIRLSDLELDWLRMKASDAGISASNLIRRLTFGKPLPKRMSKISLATYQELSRIGNNLNQLAKASNTAIKSGVQPPVDLTQLDQLLDILNQVGKELSLPSNDDDEIEDFDEDFLDDWEADEG